MELGELRSPFRVNPDKFIFQEDLKLWNIFLGSNHLYRDKLWKSDEIFCGLGERFKGIVLLKRSIIGLYILKVLEGFENLRSDISLNSVSDHDSLGLMLFALGA